MLRVLRGRRLVGEGRFLGVADPSSAGRKALREAVLDQLCARSKQDRALDRKIEDTRVRVGETRDGDDPAVRRALLDVRLDVEHYVEDVTRDLPLMPLRLLAEGKAQQVYGEFDRLRAEAEFRASVALPLLALVCVVAWRVTPWWLLALIVPVILLVEAIRNVTEAADVLAEATRAGVVGSPALAAVHTVPLQDRKLVDWLRQASERGYVEAMRHLADELERSRDTQDAEQWLGRAAEGGDAEAMFRLAGTLHRRGDPEEEAWYQKSAAYGYGPARELAEVAATLTREQLADVRSAHVGDVDAMFRTGGLFETRDPGTAEAWYRRAAAAGHRGACEAMVRLLDAQGLPDAAEDFRRNASPPGQPAPPAPAALVPGASGVPR